MKFRHFVQGAALTAFAALMGLGIANALSASPEAPEGFAAYEIGVKYGGDAYTLAVVRDGKPPITVILKVEQSVGQAVIDQLSKDIEGDWYLTPSLGALQSSCEHHCGSKCKITERAQCVANCLSGYGPRCTPVPGVAGFHWPTCHDDYPDCIPPFSASAK